MTDKDVGEKNRTERHFLDQIVHVMAVLDTSTFALTGVMEMQAEN